MAPTITLGRNPTLGEAIDYYTRDDFCRYLLDTRLVRRVVLVLPPKLHWEPNWPRDEVLAESAEQFRAFVRKKIAEQLPEIALNERPPFYPSFHQLVWTRSGGEQRPDSFFEADLPTWRDAFGDVRPILEQLDRYGVYYQHKFSGHRSLHVTVPGAVLPEGYRGKGARRWVKKLLLWGGSQAHRLPRLTRMPYSLNEDTGQVSLPIARGQLAAFRPWQANLHLVEVRDIWRDDKRPEADLNALVAALEKCDASPMAPSRRFYAIDRGTIAARYQGRMSRLQDAGVQAASVQAAGPVGAAWRQLAEERALTETSLLEGLTHAEPDA